MSLVFWTGLNYPAVNLVAPERLELSIPYGRWFLRPERMRSAKRQWHSVKIKIGDRVGIRTRV
jgi:hypothetical protein